VLYNQFISVDYNGLFFVDNSHIFFVGNWLKYFDDVLINKIYMRV